MINSIRTLLVATAKGLVTYSFDQGEFHQEGIHFLGFAVNMAYHDPRNGRWWAGVSHKHWGQKLHFSDDEGATWHEVKTPTFEGATLPNGKMAHLRQIWSMHHGGEAYPDRLWLGTDPGGLFRSDDNGLSFQLVTGLWEHPSRRKEGQWFGTGNDFPFIHSIVVDPHEPKHVFVAVSAAGVFETLDGGLNWQPRNEGLVASYLPNPNVEVGHDPHLLVMAPSDTRVIWQQNHCGIFVSKNGGGSWTDVSASDGFPSYGFSLALDDHQPGTAWVVPVESDERRIAPELRLQVFQTRDFGESWQSVSEGLPSSAFDIVLRHAFVQRGGVLVLGTTNGNLFYSTGRKFPWRNISTHLTKVNSVILI